MFGDDFYLDLVNKEFANNLTKPIQSGDLKTRASRILEKLNDYFDNNPLKDNVSFNHYRPARYFAENIAQLSSIFPPEAIERFEAAFKTLNALL